MKQDPELSAKQLPRPKTDTYFFYLSKQISLEDAAYEACRKKKNGAGGI
jgi:hypothetical protein